MATQSHTIPAAPSAIAPTVSDDVARMSSGVSRLERLHEEAGATVTALVAGDCSAGSRSTHQAGNSDVVTDHPDNIGIVDSYLANSRIAPAPLPSLTSALSRRSAILRALVVGAMPVAALAANTGDSRISIGTDAGKSGISQPDPDAELIALGREWQVSAERCDRANKALDEATLRTVEVAPPDALFQRRTDSLSFGCLAHGYRDDVRRWYPPSAVEKLRGYLFVDPWGQPLKRDRARRDEIVAASEAWTAETAAAEAASGFTLADAECDAAHDENRVLRGRIQTAEAETMAGVMTKAKVAGWCWRNAADMREQVADDVTRKTVTGEAMSFSLTADLVAMLERGAA